MKSLREAEALYTIIGICAIQMQHASITLKERKDRKKLMKKLINEVKQLNIENI